MQELTQECPKCYEKAVEWFLHFRDILVVEVTTIVDSVRIHFGWPISLPRANLCVRQVDLTIIR